MAIKRYTATADNTISNAWQANLTRRATGSNMGAADVLEGVWRCSVLFSRSEKVDLKVNR